jgi:hypothetical protein
VDLAQTTESGCLLIHVAQQILKDFDFIECLAQNKLFDQRLISRHALDVIDAGTLSQLLNK